MESRSPADERRRGAEVVVSGPEGAVLTSIELSGDRMTVGRLPEANDIALQPDPELLVTRAGHLALEREGARWYAVDGGSVNGTFLRRGGALQRLSVHTPLHDGDAVCVLASISDTGERSFFVLSFHEGGDSQATRAVAA